MHDQPKSNAPSSLSSDRVEETRAPFVSEEAPKSLTQAEEPRDKYDVGYLACTD